MQKNNNMTIDQPPVSPVSDAPSLQPGHEGQTGKTKQCRQVIERGKRIAEEVKAEGLKLTTQDYIDVYKSGRT